MMLTREHFDRTRHLALRLAGIELFERHREVLSRRSRRLGIHADADYEALLAAADDGDPRAGRQLIGLFTTKFTGFFRHPGHFQVAVERAREAVQRRGEARLWSAAAATGEEPYSLAMALLDGPGSDDPPVTILATDIDEDALLVAEQGEYAESALGGLESMHRKRFFSETPNGRRWRVAERIRDRVKFQGLNLTHPVWPIEGTFDVVFCRNALMYLEANHRVAVLERMASVLAPDGVLILDPAEHLGQAGHLFCHGTNGVYPFRSVAPARLDRTPRDCMPV